MAGISSCIAACHDALSIFSRQRDALSCPLDSYVRDHSGYPLMCSKWHMDRVFKSVLIANACTPAEISTRCLDVDIDLVVGMVVGCRDILCMHPGRERERERRRDAETQRGTVLSLCPLSTLTPFRKSGAGRVCLFVSMLIHVCLSICLVSRSLY